jgi:hypothetical protein
MPHSGILMLTRELSFLLKNVQGLLVEPQPAIFKRGLAKHRNALQINTCLSPQPRTTYLSFE